MDIRLLETQHAIFWLWNQSDCHKSWMKDHAVQHFVSHTTLASCTTFNLEEYISMSCSHWKCTSSLQKHMIFVCFYALLSCLHTCILSSDMNNAEHSKIEFHFKHSRNGIT